MSSAMSTPISNIPVHNVSAQEEDPEVTAILQEMQQPQQSSKPSEPMMHTSYNMHMMPPPQAMHIPTMHIEQKDTSKKELFDMKIAQRVTICAVIAYVMFYPKTLEILYEKVPVLQRFSTYDSFIRFFLLAVVLYALMWKFNI